MIAASGKTARRRWEQSAQPALAGGAAPLRGLREVAIRPIPAPTVPGRIAMDRRLDYSRT